MRKHTIDTVLRVRLPHRPGQLARLTSAIAGEGGLLGEIDTLRRGEEDTVRDVTIETNTDEHTRRVIAAVLAVEGVELLDVRDHVLEIHRGGKIHSGSRITLTSLRDLRAMYTPGVARVVHALVEDPERAWEFTAIGRSVGIFTNGTRVLGLGPVGPVASLPVMEGKAVLYDQLGHMSATPIVLDEEDPHRFVELVVRIAPSFGGIHLEDIRSPDCYLIEDLLKERLDKPVMHDDQHGTAVAALAAVLNACELQRIKLRTARVGVIGVGAAGSAVAKLLLAYGVEEVMASDVDPVALARAVGFGVRAVPLATLMAQAQIVLAATGRPGLIKPEWIRKGQIIFSLSNPDAEIDPAEAMAAGAAFASDGRSINNALAFPGLFAGALKVRSRAITPEMFLAAAEAIAHEAEPGEVVPSPLSPSVHQAVIEAVASRARTLGLAGTARAQPRRG